MRQCSPAVLNDRHHAKDRQALCFALMNREPTREWTVGELAERLRRHGNTSLIESALQSLVKGGLVVPTYLGGGGRGRSNRYRVVAVNGVEEACAISSQ